jgi:hypothetical protein
MNKYLGVAIIIVIVAGAAFHGGAIFPFIDTMALIFVLGIGIGHALGAKDGESKITRFGDGSIRGGWLGLLVGLVLIAGTDGAAQMDFTMLMPAMAVALLTPFYGYFFKVISMQLD